MGGVFDHRLCHLAYSGLAPAEAVLRGESCHALARGLDRTLRLLAGLPREHRGIPTYKIGEGPNRVEHFLPGSAHEQDNARQVVEHNEDARGRLPPLQNNSYVLLSRQL